MEILTKYLIPYIIWFVIITIWSYLKKENKQERIDRYVISFIIYSIILILYFK